MNKQATLRIGDVVLWSGAFGTDAPCRAVVLSIQETEHVREKNGCDVEKIDWQTVYENRAIIGVRGEGSINDNWAYGEQIVPYEA